MGGPNGCVPLLWGPLCKSSVVTVPSLRISRSCLEMNQVIISPMTWRPSMVLEKILKLALLDRHPPGSAISASRVCEFLKNHYLREEVKPIRNIGFYLRLSLGSTSLNDSLLSMSRGLLKSVAFKENLCSPLTSGIPPELLPSAPGQLLTHSLDTSSSCAPGRNNKDIFYV